MAVKYCLLDMGQTGRGPRDIPSWVEGGLFGGLFRPIPFLRSRAGGEAKLSFSTAANGELPCSRE